MKQKLLIVLAFILIGITSKVQAYSFSAVCSSGQTLYYNIKTSNTVEVTSQYLSYPYYNSKPTGALIIPDSVSYNGTIYSVTSIGNEVFSTCSGLTSITIPNSVTSIGNKVFNECGNLTSVIMPNSVTSIGNDVFYNCKNLTSITIPNSVTSIGGSAFSGCSGLTSIIIPNSVTSIGGYAFQNCSSLASITIPNSVVLIGPDAFYNTPYYNNIPNGVIYINNMLYKYKGTMPYGTTINIPIGIINICRSAFQSCTNLTSIIIPNSVTSIGEYAFSYCSNLNSITIPNSITSIGEYAFYNCTSLASITIPNAITSIENSTFWACCSLTSITIPNSVTSIGRYAFSECKFTSVTIPSSITTIGSAAFSNCSSLNSITIPNSVTSIGGGAFSGTPYYNNMPDGIVYINSVLYKYKGTMPVGTSINIPTGIVSISDYAFSMCSGLTSITIPNSVTSIKDYVFSQCSGLTSVPIPNSVTSIGDHAFYHCSSLASITIPDSVTSIGNNAFSYCTGLTSIACKAINPPSLKGNQTFFFANNTIPVYVPCASKSNYQTAPNWSDFNNFIGIKNTQNISASICQGNIYTNYGANIDSSGVYTFVNGCDSVILNLTVTPIHNDTITSNICQGLVYNQYGFNADSTGIYTQNLQTINGCDSIITLNLTVNPISQTSYIDSICQGQNYNNYGFNFIADTTGLYTQNLHTINGCDSIITLNLTVNPSPITPNGLLIKKKPTYLEISWDGNGDRYEVYRNDSLIASTSQAIYQDSNVLYDSSYCYKVKAFLEACESDMSKSACMRIAGLKDININNQDITLYPNPTSSDIYLKIDQSIIGSGYTITNTLGKIVLQGKLLDVSMNINLNDFPQGIYFLNIEKTKQTLKVIKQ